MTTPPRRPLKPRMSRRKSLASAALMLLSACVMSTASAAQPVAPRAIGVGGGVTEIVYALGAQDLLVGSDTSSTWPAAALTLPKVGYQRTLAAEGVLSMHPTVVLASHEAGPPVVLKQIEDAGVRVIRVEGDYTFEGLLKRVRLIAAALGRQQDGEQLAQRLTQQWQDLQARMRARPAQDTNGRPLRVAFVMTHGGGSMAAGRGTGADALLRLAGAENAFGKDFDDYKPLSPESLAAAAPDVIIATADRPEAAEAALASMRTTPGIAQTPAVKHGRVAALDIVLTLGFGPRLPEAVDAVYHALLK